jgi:hypothetical protein
MRSMTTANNSENNLSPWQPGQSGNPSGGPKGTRDLAGYVLETTDGGKELVDALVSIARGVMPNVLEQEGSRPLRTSRPAKGHRDSLRPWLRQVTTATRHSPQCLQQAAGAIWLMRPCGC